MIEYTVKVFDNCTEWYNKDGKRHRENGHAVEWTNGDKSWYLNGKRHRENGPAIEWANGHKEWYLNGKLHREDGPAIEYSYGYKAWYLNGKEYSEADSMQRLQGESNSKLLLVMVRL